MSKKGRQSKKAITKEQLEQLLNNGLSYSEVSSYIKEQKGLDISRVRIYQLADKWKLRDLNVHKLHKDYCKKRLIPLERINVGKTPTAFLDIVKPTSRRQKGKQTREISKAAFLSFTQVLSYREELPDLSSLKVELEGNKLSSEIFDKVQQLVKKELIQKSIILGKTYLVLIPDQTRQNIAVGLTKLVKYLRDHEIILVDTELNPKMDKEFWIEGRHIEIMNSLEWHAKENYVEKKHGFKTNIYAKFKAFKKSAYKKLSSKDKALLLKKYLEFCSLNRSYEIVNTEAVEKKIAELEREKIILTVSSL